MPRHPSLSSLLGVLIVVVAAVAMVRPEVDEGVGGLAANRADPEPASVDSLRLRETPMDLPENLPRPESWELIRPAKRPAEASRPKIPGSPRAASPAAPLAPVADPDAW